MSEQITASQIQTGQTVVRQSGVGSEQVTVTAVYVTGDLVQLDGKNENGDDVQHFLAATSPVTVVDVEPTGDFGILYDYVIGGPIGPATRAQRDASRAAGETGVFTVDRNEEPCPPDADPAVFGPVRTVYVDES